MIEQKLAAVDVSVAPLEWPIHSQATSVLPSPPIVSSSHACVDREPEITAAKTKVTHDGSDSGIDSDSSNANSDSDLDSANSDSDLDGTNSDSDLDVTWTLPMTKVFDFYIYR